MTRFILGVLFGMLLFFLFLYFGGPGYVETLGEKTEEAGKSLKKYEKTTKDTTRKVGEKYEDIKKKFGSDD